MNQPENNKDIRDFHTLRSIISQSEQPHLTLKEINKEIEEYRNKMLTLNIGQTIDREEIIEKLKEKNVSGKIIVSQYQNFTDPQALKNIIDKFPNIDLRIVTQDIIKLADKYEKTIITTGFATYLQ